MPQKTAVPMATRISAPAPLAIISGSTPKANANEVIKIGRNRNRLASMTASSRFWPASCNWRANSTIRMAFLHARPISTTMPIWVKRLLSKPRAHTPRMAKSRLRGTTRMMASGSDQLSYWAASTRKTISTHSGRMRIAVLPAWICSRVSSVHSMAMPGGRTFPARSLISSIASPELAPGARLPVISAVGYML